MTEQRNDPSDLTKHDLVKIRIPAEFVLAHTRPTSAELVYGVRHGWLLAEDVVAIALAAVKARAALNEPEEALALLLSDEMDQVPRLIDELDTVCDRENDPAALWVYLALARLYEERAEYDDPFETIEMLYADFNYPDDLHSIIRYMPPPSGTVPGSAALEENWRTYLERKRAEYSARQSDHVS